MQRVTINLQLICTEALHFIWLFCNSLEHEPYILQMTGVQHVIKPYLFSLTCDSHHCKSRVLGQQVNQKSTFQGHKNAKVLQCCMPFYPFCHQGIDLEIAADPSHIFPTVLNCVGDWGGAVCLVSFVSQIQKLFCLQVWLNVSPLCFQQPPKKGLVTLQLDTVFQHSGEQYNLEWIH